MIDCNNYTCTNGIFVNGCDQVVIVIDCFVQQPLLHDQEHTDWVDSSCRDIYIKPVYSLTFNMTQIGFCKEQLDKGRENRGYFVFLSTLSHISQYICLPLLVVALIANAS